LSALWTSSDSSASTVLACRIFLDVSMRLMSETGAAGADDGCHGLMLLSCWLFLTDFELGLKSSAKPFRVPMSVRDIFVMNDGARYVAVSPLITEERK